MLQWTLVIVQPLEETADGTRDEDVKLKMESADNWVLLTTFMESTFTGGAWRQCHSLPLFATFTLALQLPPRSLQCRHIFSLRSLCFSIQLSPRPPPPPPPLYSFVRPSPAVLFPSKTHLLPPLPFIPSLETSLLQGKNSAAHFVSPFVSIHSPLLAFLIFSLTISFLFTIQ